MSDEKMREEFEAWYLKQFGKCDMHSSWAMERWEAWQASRATLVIDFSPCNVQHSSYNNVDCYAITDVAVILKRAGVKVKP